MKKFLKILFIILVILVAMIAVLFIVRELNVKSKEVRRNINNVNNVSDKTIIEWAKDLYNKDDYNEIKIVYKNLLDRNIETNVLEENNCNDNFTIACLSKYFVSLLVTNDSYISEIYYKNLKVLNDEDFELFLTINFSLLSSYDKVEGNTSVNVCESIYSIALSKELNTEKSLELLSFNYYYGIYISKDVSEIKEEIKKLLLECNIEYDKYVEKERSLYLWTLIDNNANNEFKTFFVNVYGENEPFSGADILYMIKHQNYSDEKIAVIIEALNLLEKQTDNTNYARLLKIQQVKNAIDDKSTITESNQMS